MEAEMDREITEGNKVIPIERLVRIYVKIRDAKCELKKVQDAEMRALSDQQDRIAVELKKRAMEAGVNAFKTDAGTASMTTSIRASCSDWDAFGVFLKDQDPIEFLGKSVKSATIRAYMDEHDGGLPPGINIFKEVSVSVKRASSNQ
jgi:hypothetical protein